MTLLSNLTASCRAPLLAVAACFVTATAPAAGFSGIVAFGDSLTDRGNTVSLLGPFAYYADYDDVYYEATGGGYGIPAQGRWSNGPTWVEYLNGNLINNQTGSAPVDLGQNGGLDPVATNFAWAGSLSGTGSRMIQGVIPLSNMRTQVESYTNLYTNGSSLPEISTTLFTIWTGGNDAIGWVNDGDGNETTRNALADAAANNIMAAVVDLYNLGARNILIPNLPGLGNKPDFVRDPALRDEANAFAERFNLTLALNLDDLEGTYGDLNLFRLDVYAIFEDLLANPEAYGLSVTDEQAYVFNYPDSTIVENPDDYVFWDNTHPTTVVHEILGNLAYQAVTGIPEPGSTFLLGLGTLWLIRRRLKKAA